MKDSQTRLFNPRKYKDATQIKKHKEWVKSLTPEDKAYLTLLHHGFALKNHIYEGKQCKARLAFYLTNSNLFGETATKLCKIISHIQPRAYYHCVVSKNPFKVHLYKYDEFILKQINKSFSSQK